MMNRVFGLLMISVFLMSCNSTGFLSNSGDNGKKSKRIEAGSNAEIGYRNGRFLPTEEELDILTSAENSKMVDYDLDEALDAVENSFTEDLGIGLVDLELESSKDVELAIDHALASFTTADIAALTQIQEGTNEYYDPYFDFEKEYGYSISESDRYNIVHFPELIIPSKESGSLSLNERQFNEDWFINNGTLNDFENHFIDTTRNGYGGQRAVDDWNSQNPYQNHRLEYLNTENGPAFELRSQDPGAPSRGWRADADSQYAWSSVPNPDGSRYVYTSRYNSEGKEVTRFIQSYNQFGRQKLQSCPEGFILSSWGNCRKEETTSYEFCGTTIVETEDLDGNKSHEASDITCSQL